MKKKNLIIILSIVICISLCIPMLIWYNDYKNILSTLNKATISDYEEIDADASIDLNTKNATSSIEYESNNHQPEDIEDISAIYSSVSEKGTKIIELQKTFTKQTWEIGYDTERWEEAQNEVSVTRENLKSFFLTSDTLGVPWYSYDITKIDPSWTFLTDLDYSDTQIPVCWICANDDNTILAVIVADYDIESDIFWNTRVYQTAYSTEYLMVDVDPSVEAEEDYISSTQFISGVKSIADALEEYTEPLVVEPDEIPYKYDYDEEETGR